MSYFSCRFVIKQLSFVTLFHLIISSHSSHLADYLEDGAPYGLSIERPLVNEVTKKIDTGAVEEAFDLVSSDLVHLLETTLLPKYLQSVDYKVAKGESMTEAQTMPLMKTSSSGSRKRT